METTLKTSRNAAMQKVLAALERVAVSDLSVLVVGEVGTGKEWAAHSIHKLSARANGPFEPVDCSTLPPDSLERELFGFEAVTWGGVEVKRGSFEEASGGTLLLDEIAAIPPATQKKIARVLEYQHVRRNSGEEDIQVDVRVIATLRQQPDKPAGEGELQKDLYYMISPVVLDLLPLRKRKEDLHPLIDRFIRDLYGGRHGSAVHSMSQEAFDLCERYDWPGNIRQLRNVVEHATVMCSGAIIQPDHLPAYLHHNRG